jgi:hypothetical protein
MALRSANGWSANDRSVIASYSLPGGRVALRKGDVSVVLLWCASRWHERMEPLVWPGVWGYAERLIRGSSTTISNHASGTAIDINAPQHPLGVPAVKTFSTLEIRAIHAILDYCEGVVRWGGDYDGRPDSMHLEINSDAAGVRRIADKIRAAAKPRVTLTPDTGMRLYPATGETFYPLARPLPVPALSREDPMLIKSQPDKSKPVYVSALLSGPMFVGLGPTETPTDEQARQAGIPVLWVEYGTWQELDRRSHALCDNPRPVVTQSPVVRAMSAPGTFNNIVANGPSGSATRPPSESSTTVASSPNPPGPSA